MRLMFIHHVLEDRGSAQDMFHYARVAKALGHEVVLFGAPGRPSAFNYTTDLSSVDAAIFIFEFTTQLQYGDLLGLGQAARTNPALAPGGDRLRRKVQRCDPGDRRYQPRRRRC